MERGGRKMGGRWERGGWEGERREGERREEDRREEGERRVGGREEGAGSQPESLSGEVSLAPKMIHTQNLPEKLLVNGRDSPEEGGQEVTL